MKSLWDRGLAMFQGQVFAWLLLKTAKFWQVESTVNFPVLPQFSARQGTNAL